MTQYAADIAALEAAGKRQVLKREWNFVAILALAAVSLSTWEATSALFAAAYLNGGPASVVYGFIIATGGTLCIAGSMAEMASISPIAGAQYHWSAEHSPPRIRAIISYIQGWVTITGWVAACASGAFLVAALIQGVAILKNPTYVPQRWHLTLMMICVSGLATLMNTFGKKLMPIWETLAGLFHVLFFFIILIALNASGDKASNKDVWGTFINAGGWPNDGVSFCLGFVTPAFALAGVDAVVHLSEETHNAAKTIPRAMVWAVIINGIAGVAYIITILYSITDVESVFETPTGFPIIAVFQQATHNTLAATATMVGIILVLTMGLFGAITSVSRLIWAFARDSGLPFSPTFSHITAWNKCPTNAVLAIFASTTLLSLINIGSSTAFNALISLTTLGFYFSYALPILMFAIRRFDATNRPVIFGPWSMGRLGLSVNILALAFCVFLIIFLPFPAVLPVTRENMNYASPVFVAVMVFALVNYVLSARKTFVGPVEEIIGGSESGSQVLEGREGVIVEGKGGRGDARERLTLSS